MIKPLKAYTRELVAELTGDIDGTIRVLLGGALMGVANIIPGVSGGTMLLALGLYERFVESVATVSRIKLRPPAVVFLFLLLCSAVAAILAMVVPITYGLENFHHIMYALFIGLTLGGVPLLWKEIDPLVLWKKKEGTEVVGAFVGFLAGIGLMIYIALFLQGADLGEGWLLFFFAGVLGSAAMVLPGISGSYLLLIFGLYLPVTTGIKDFASAVKDVDFAAAFDLALALMLPVGLGVLAGVAGLTNALKALLDRFHKPTLGVLLGLLIGSVIGLNPFGPLMEKGEVLHPAHPASASNVAAVGVALVAGLLITLAVTRLKPQSPIAVE